MEEIFLSPGQVLGLGRYALIIGWMVLTHTVLEP